LDGASVSLPGAACLLLGGWTLVGMFAGVCIAMLGKVPLALGGVGGTGVERSRIWLTLDVYTPFFVVRARDGEMGGDGVISLWIWGNGRGGGIVPFPCANVVTGPVSKSVREAGRGASPAVRVSGSSICWDPVWALGLLCGYSGSLTRLASFDSFTLLCGGGGCGRCHGGVNSHR